jgi:DNA-binding NarL/FixJ family response regulator
LVEALETVYADSLSMYLADLAVHAYEGGLWEQSMHYAQRAGEHAQCMYAPEAAIPLFSRALEAARRLSYTPPAHLYRARARAYETLGDFERAHADFETAAQTAQAAADLHEEWQTLLDLGFLWAGRDYAQAAHHYQQALTLARQIEDAAILGHTLNRVGNWYVNIEQTRLGASYHHEALALFEELGDRRGIAQTLDLLAMASTQLGDPQSTQYYERAVALFHELDDRYGLASSLAMLGLLHTLLEDETMTAQEPSAGIHELETALKLTQEIGWRSGETFALLQLGYVLGLRGDYGRALNAVQRALEIATEIGHHQWMAGAHRGFGVASHDLLAPAQARTHLEVALALARETGSLIWVYETIGYLAESYCLEHDVDRAEALLDSVELSDLPPTRAQRVCWHSRAMLALTHGDFESALHLSDHLNESDSTILYRIEWLVPHPQQLRAEALAALGRMADAETTLDLALSNGSAQSRPSQRWRLHVSRAKLYLSQNRLGEAEQEFTVARTILDRLAATIPDDTVRIDFLSRASAFFPAQPPLTPRQAAKRDFEGLTEREREVAVLIAQGYSNRAIAETLVVSQRTASTHVSNILGKLGLTSRTQIAAWAIERGLAQPGIP